MTLDKILQRQGFGTRRECRRLIRDGSVSVNGEVIETFDEELETAGLEFIVDGTRWRYLEKVYVALNKPLGFECSRSPTHHLSVLSLLSEPLIRRGVQPVGRLDQDTTGLLLLSDDGQFIHAQTSPKRHVPKTYVVTTHDPVSEEMVQRLKAGVALNDDPEPVAAIEARVTGERALELVLDRGKYHQVRRMIAAVGNHCTALHRSAIGNVSLEVLALEPGQWCFVDVGADAPVA